MLEWNQFEMASELSFQVPSTWNRAQTSFPYLLPEGLIFEPHGIQLPVEVDLLVFEAVNLVHDLVDLFGLHGGRELHRLGLRDISLDLFQ